MKTNETDALNEVIILLDQRRKIELRQFKNQASEIYHRVQPSNLLKKFTREIASSPEIKLKLFQVGLGWLAGFVFKRLVLGPAPGIVRKGFGFLAQFAVRKLTSRIFRR